MIWLYLAAAVAALFTFAFGVLPGPDFLPIPAAATTALSTVVSWLAWATTLLGDDVRAAGLAAGAAYIAISVAFFLWDVIRTFTFPVINKFLR